MTSKHRPWALVQVPPSTRFCISPGQSVFGLEVSNGGLRACEGSQSVTFGNVRCRVVGRRSHTLVFGFLKWLVTGLVFAQGVAVRAIASIRWLVGALFGGFPRVPEVRVGDHVALFDAISADDGVGEARLIAAMVEIEASKAENDRLRSFLGLDRAARNGSFGTSRSPRATGLVSG